MLLAGVVSSDRVLGLACATIGRWSVGDVLKSVVNITCLRYTLRLTVINLSKTRIDFANEVWVRERMFGRMEEGWERGEVKRREGLMGGATGGDYFEVVWAQRQRGQWREERARDTIIARPQGHP